MYTKLFTLIKDGRLDDAMSFIRNGADINEPVTQEGLTPLAVSLSPFTSTSYETVEFLIGAGADVNSQDIAGITPTMLAFEWYPLTPKFLRLFLDAGADIEVRDNRGNSFLDYIFENMFEWDDQIASVLDDYGISTPFKNIHDAVTFGNSRDVALCILAGEDVDKRDDEGRTPLMTTMIYNRELKTIDYLLSREADIDARDTAGKTPLMYAASFDDSGKLVSMLLRYGADIRAKDANGQSAIDHALDNNSSFPVLKILLNELRPNNNTGLTS